MHVRTGVLFLLAAAACALAGCGGSSSSVAPYAGAGARGPTSSVPSPIAHVVILVQENRTFNNFFATFPGADGTTTGKVVKDGNCGISKTGTIALTQSPLVIAHDLAHNIGGYETAYDKGKMDAFDKVPNSAKAPECTFPYQYTNPAQIAPYWDMAEQYVLAEHMFTTQGSSSFVAHQDLIAGGTQVSNSPPEAVTNDPSCNGLKCYWGCDAPKGTRTSLVTQNGVWKPYVNKGPFPCFTYATMRDLLDAGSVSWRYYVPPTSEQFGKLMSAYDAIKAVRYGPEWTDGHISTPQTNIFSDISGGTLQNVSWVMPDEPDSDHPGESKDTGPEWVASVVNAIGQSQYWNSTAIIIVWDDWGGLYDNLAPQQVGFGGLGFRVPAIVISPYAKIGSGSQGGYISTTQYEFGSILKYIEQNWNLGSLGTSDQRANSLIDSFDYTQSPRTFSVIPSSLSKEYFIRRKPSYLPIDTDF
jgi:phospholipase C